jgi:MtN3 and saliva related transmembrane protein|tara:strand:+ start:52 stop:315 length:264 start_codon:yes stop_codon:yes gene_type:complete
MIDSTNFFGLLGGFLTTVAFVPQVLKSWRAKSVKDLSLIWLIIFNSGVTFWLIYGLLKSDIAIILANSVTLILSSSLLVMKLKEFYK